MGDLQQAALLLASSAMVGTRKAWDAYTSERKRASADGKITPEEAAQARKVVNALRDALKSARLK